VLCWSFQPVLPLLSILLHPLAGPFLKLPSGRASSPSLFLTVPHIFYCGHSTTALSLAHSSCQTGSQRKCIFIVQVICARKAPRGSVREREYWCIYETCSVRSKPTRLVMAYHVVSKKISSRNHCISHPDYSDVASDHDEFLDGRFPPPPSTHSFCLLSGLFSSRGWYYRTGSGAFRTTLSATFGVNLPRL
jgi:hypothetical protein